jgi:hypothetical protein
VYIVMLGQLTRYRTQLNMGDASVQNNGKTSHCYMLLATCLQPVSSSRLYGGSINTLHTPAWHSAGAIQPLLQKTHALTTDSGFIKAVEVNSLADVDQTRQSLRYHRLLLEQNTQHSIISWNFMDTKNISWSTSVFLRQQFTCHCSI